jgi:hypothetical protein
MDGSMDYIDEFFSSLSPEELAYAQKKMAKGGPKVEIEIGDDQEEPNDSDSDEYTNGKGPNNEAKGGDGNATVPKALSKRKTMAPQGDVPLKENAMFDEEE